MLHHMIMIIIENGLGFLGIQPYILFIVRGIVIFIAMYMETLRAGSHTRSGFLSGQVKENK